MKYLPLVISTLIMLGALWFSYRTFAHKPIIYVYQDAGVDEKALTHTLGALKKIAGKTYRISTLSAQTLVKGQWMSTAKLLVMPGGADLPYVKKLQGKGNQLIQTFVAEGGAYLGICAGSYYGASKVEFDKHGPLEVLGTRELSFFPGTAIGPILAAYDYHTNSGARAAQIETKLPNLKNVTVYYNGGGYFENAQQTPNTQIIANYKNHLPAIIHIHYGKGNVILSGVHFETAAEDLERTDPHLAPLIPLLNKDRIKRHRLQLEILKLLGIS